MISSSDDMWYTPLIVALINGRKDAFTFLIDKGADVNLQDCQGYTALHHAVLKRKNFDVLRCLVYNRADVNLQDRNGQTPLMQASCNKDVKKVAMLIENGAKVDLQDVDGNTALHHAMLNSHDSHKYTPEICLALLTAKASNLCNSQGWTPLLLASKNCIESVVEKFSKQPEITKEQKANALELLGASLNCLKSLGTFAFFEGFRYIKRGMKERFADASHPLLKQQVEPVEAYQNRRECQTLEELAEIEGLMRMLSSWKALLLEKESLEQTM